MRQAMDVWGQRNIKTVQYADIEDFFNEQTNISKKTLHNMRSCLNQFFEWVESRESQYQKPELPEVKFTLGMRNIISKQVQTKILDEIKRIAPFKVWLGIRWLSIYVNMRPIEMVRIKEKNIIDGMLLLHPNTTKEKKPKFVPLIKEDINLLAGTTKGFPEQYFFRHEKGAGQAKIGSQYGPRYLYKWWVKACENLGIKGIDLYGGTRHSSVTALSQQFSAEEIKEHGTGHDTSKAFERYFQAEAKVSRVIFEAADVSPKTEKPPKKVVSLNDYR